MKTRNRIINYAIISAVLVMALLLPVLAQEKPPAPAPANPPQLPAPTKEERSIYRLQINVNEVEAGKVVNSRSFQMVIEDNGNGTVRVTREIPVQLGSSGFQYKTVGLTLSCRIREGKDHLAVTGRFSLNDVVAGDSTSGSTSPLQPVIRGYDSDLSTALKSGVPTVIAVMDSMTGKGRLELEMTATKLLSSGS